MTQVTISTDVALSEARAEIEFLRTRLLVSAQAIKDTRAVLVASQEEAVMLKRVIEQRNARIQMLEQPELPEIVASEAVIDD